MMMKERLGKNLNRVSATLRRRAEALLQKSAAVLVLECLARFALTLLLSRARIFGAYAPFGVSMLAASGPGLRGASALAGALLGYLVMGGLSWGLKYLAMCVLIFSATFVFQETAVYKKSFFVPVVAAAIGAIAGFVYMSDAGFSLNAVVFYITETVLIGGCTLFFRIALSPWNAEEPESAARHKICLLILGAAALVALSRIYLAGIISLGRCAAVLAVMVAARRGGLGAGAAAGIALGFSMDAALGRSVFFSMIYSFSGLVSGAFSRQKRLFFTLAYVLANLIATLWAWDSQLRNGSLYEIFIASVIFMVLPANLLISKKSSQGAAGAASLRRYNAWRLGQVSEAFRTLYENLRGGRPQPPNDGDISKTFVRAAALCCRGCRRATDCWDLNHSSTMSALNDATPAMVERGSLTLQDLPSYFTQRCLKPEAYVSAVNDSLRAALYRRQSRARILESRQAAVAQYREMAGILEAASQELSTDLYREAALEGRLSLYLQGSGIPAAVSVFRDARGRLRAEISGALAELKAQPDHLDKLSAVLGTRLCAKSQPDSSRLTLLEAEPLAAAVGAASMRRAGQSVCGDSESFFKTEGGELYVLLSDGMGSGEGAARLSGESISILERFLRAGLEPEAALRILSSALVLRGDENGCTTADILRADLFSGKVQLCKCGAAPTYVRHGDNIRRIGCTSPAVGLSGCTPEKTELELSPDSLILMLSDGVLEGGDDKWLREKLSAFQGQDVKTFAAELLSAAMDAHGGEDDMTVLCILLSHRE